MTIFRLAVFLLAAAAALAQSPAEIGPIVQELSRITGWAAKRKIPSQTIDRQHLKEFLEARIRQTVKPAEIRAEELTLVKFGFVPAGFDLRKSTVDLMTEQAAAFYDYRKKKLFLLDYTAGGAMQKPALVHEIAHALADQHFKLGRYIKDEARSDDGDMARLAVMEGQATWLMTEYFARKSGSSLIASPSLAAMAARESDEPAGAYPVLEGMPLYMRESLLFPYTTGMLFQQKLVERDGKEGFSEPFRRPPSSSQQVIHPEKYFERALPADIKAPAIPDARRYRTLSEGSVGEFDHAVLLRQYAGTEESKQLSPHWRGGAYRLFEGKADPRLVLAYRSAWDSEESSRSYFTRYLALLAKKWKALERIEQAPDRVVGRGDDGFFVLRRQGVSVASIEGLKTLQEARAASTLD